jgi:hypothetical protein
VPKLRCPSSTPPGSHYVSGVPLCSVTFGTSRIAESTTPSPCCWKPRMPNPRCSGFVPPVSPRIDGPDQIGRSPFAISTCMCFLHSPTPIRRYPMTTNSCLRSRVNHLAIFARSDDPLGLRKSARLSKSSVLFLCEEISVLPPSSRATSTESIPSVNERLPLLSFVLDSFRDFLNTPVCTRPSTIPKR